MGFLTCSQMVYSINDVMNGWLALSDICPITDQVTSCINHAELVWLEGSSVATENGLGPIMVASNWSYMTRFMAAIIIPLVGAIET